MEQSPDLHHCLGQSPQHFRDLLCFLECAGLEAVPALEKAGVSESQVKRYKSELDFDDGIYKYEIEFFADGYEYDIEVAALDGTVTAFSKEKEIFFD